MPELDNHIFIKSYITKAIVCKYPTNAFWDIFIRDIVGYCISFLNLDSSVQFEKGTIRRGNLNDLHHWFFFKVNANIITLLNLLITIAADLGSGETLKIWHGS